jgi:PIN domain nuclease of toxin-antitoxin system
MNLLLDTHAFLWFMEGNAKLSDAARVAIESGEGERWLSVASAWEMAIKTSLGKLNLAKPLDELLPALLADSGIATLAIEIADVARVATLPFHHRDPRPLVGGVSTRAQPHDGERGRCVGCVWCSARWVARRLRAAACDLIPGPRSNKQPDIGDAPQPRRARQFSRWARCSKQRTDARLG